MRPTVGEQLAAIRRMIDAVRADPAADPDATAATLELVSGQLRRLERSEPHRLAFLVEDNIATAQLLADLAVVLPSLAPPAAPADAVTGEAEAGARNDELRALLVRAVRELPDGPDGDAGRERIAAHLRRRIERNPALGPVRPVRPGPESNESTPSTVTRSEAP